MNEDETVCWEVRVDLLIERTDEVPGQELFTSFPLLLPTSSSPLASSCGLCWRRDAEPRDQYFGPLHSGFGHRD